MTAMKVLQCSIEGANIF